MDGVVRLALVHVTSENLRLVSQSGCHNISAGCMGNILQYILRAVATRAHAVLGAPVALDLFALLRSFGEEGKCYSFSDFSILLQQAPDNLPSHPPIQVHPILVHHFFVSRICINIQKSLSSPGKSLSTKEGIGEKGYLMVVNLCTAWFVAGPVPIDDPCDTVFVLWRLEAKSSHTKSALHVYFKRLLCLTCSFGGWE